MTSTNPGSGNPGEDAAHLVVWLDHRLARIYVLSRGPVHECHNSETGEGHVHHHADAIGSGHIALNERYLESISDAISNAREILIVGPADAKTALKSFLERRKPLQAANIVAVEPLDHISDGQILTYAREFFARADRMTPPSQQE